MDCVVEEGNLRFNGKCVATNRIIDDGFRQIKTQVIKREGGDSHQGQENLLTLAVLQNVGKYAVFHLWRFTG